MTSIEATDLTPRTRPWLTRARIARPSTWFSKYRYLLLATDAALIAVTITVSYFVRFGDEMGAQVSGSTVPYAGVGVMIGIFWMLMLDATESRSRKVIGAGLDEYQRVINGSLYTFGAVAIGSYLAQAQISRLFFVTTLPLGAALLLGGRWVCRAYLNRARSGGRALTRAILVGDPDWVVEALKDMRRHPEAGYQPSAACLLGPPPVTDRSWDLRSVRCVDYRQLDSFLGDGQVGAVVVAGGLSQAAARRLSWSLENTPVELIFVPKLTDVAGPRISMRTVDGLGLMQVDLPRYSGWNYLLKRAFDLVFASVALAILAPVLLVVALLIKLDDGGPVLFRQQRIGLRGEPFTIHKFRTMCVDAEAKIDALIAAQGGTALLFKLEDDPRITRIGRFLRKYSIDELPQFWTALRGGMSVVGPRPQVAREVAEYTDIHHRRLLIKPGITGLWPVNGRSELSMEESIRLDLRYVENWSLVGDVVIILKTVGVVLRPSGAF